MKTGNNGEKVMLYTIACKNGIGQEMYYDAVSAKKTTGACLGFIKATERRKFKAEKWHSLIYLAERKDAEAKLAWLTNHVELKGLYLIPVTPLNHTSNITVAEGIKVGDKVCYYQDEKLKDCDNGVTLEQAARMMSDFYLLSGAGVSLDVILYGEAA